MKIKFYSKRLGGQGYSLLFVLAVLLSTPMYAQSQFRVSGQVIDGAEQLGLLGANIIEKGTSNGTIADMDGNFSLDVASGDAVLVFSFTGYATQEVEVNGQSTLNVTLQEDAETLDEVVVVGYKTIKKSDLTGAVGSLGAEALTERGMTNALEAVQGNVAGVQISNSTGRIGDGFDIVIRGNNSLNPNSAPLFVVDGVPLDNIDFLNPQDIDRIDILKDASSTAIYGSRGSNGVVIVTTKNGASAKPGLNISLDSYVGTKKVARLPQMMSPEKWAYYHTSAYLATTNLNDPLAITPEQLEGKVIGSANTELRRRFDNLEAWDWYDLVLQDGFQQNTYLNFSGTASGSLGYNLGFGYQNETGNIENESLDKYTFKAGINHKVSDKFTYGFNSTIALSKDQFGSDVAMREAFRLNPFLSPYGIDGETLEPQPGKLRDENGDFIVNKTSTYNPLLEIANSDDERRRWRGVASLYAGYSITGNITFKSTFSPSFTNTRRGRAWGAQTNRGISNNNLPSADLSNSQRFSYTWDNQVDFDYDLGEDHRVSVLALQSIYSDQTEGSTISARNLPFDTDFYNIGSGDQSTFNLGSSFVKQTLASFALRANYSFQDRFLVTLSNRWDGSSLLSEDNRWDFFPSGAVAWNLGNEAFLADADNLSNLKVRVSYGFTGNNIISPYSTTNSLSRQTFYDFGGSTANGWLPSGLANTALGWEKTRELNFGVDFGFLKDRISGSLDIYDRLSDDLLLSQDLPIESGGGEISANVGSVSNKGVEVLLTTRNVQRSNISWSTTFTFTKNTNSIESIYGQSEVDDVGNGWFIGEAINSNYNYVFDGIWQANERDAAASYGQLEGQAKVVDINNDGKISPNDDRTILGSEDPSWSGSVFSSLRVGDFDLGISVFGNRGVHVFSPFIDNFTDTRDRGRQKLDIGWYVPENGAGVEAQFDNEYPQPRNQGTFWRSNNVGAYRDASFWKVKNIALGYTLNDKAVDNLGLGSLRIYANVLNPFVFSDYEGYDPEWAGASLNIGRVGSVTYQFGVNVNF